MNFPMIAFNFLKSVLFFFGLLIIGILKGCAEQDIHPPNVVLIMTDDQGYGDMSCNGHPTLKTPNLDRLYNEGIHFSDFHVSCYCAPTRASLMTGRDFRRVGVWHTYGGRNWLFEDELTMADVFKNNGYRTGHFGKWHLGHNYPFAPHFRGFETSLMLGNGGLGAADGYWGNDRFDDTYFLNGVPEKTAGFSTDVYVDYAIDFIEKHKEEPFFVYLATNLPHRPWNIPSEYREKFDSSIDDDREVVPYNHTDMARFYGSIDKIDEQVGRMLNYLEVNGLLDNTIVVFLTDNGTVSREYNAGMKGRKGSEYEGGHRVPLLIRWPNGEIQEGGEITSLTTHMDILPTLIDLCQLKLEKEIKFDGQSLAPLLFNDTSNWNNSRFYITQSIQNLPGNYQFSIPKWGKTVVCKQEWRLVNDELFNILMDPGQKNNIAGEHPDVVHELKNCYEDNYAEILPHTEKIARVHIGSQLQEVTRLTLAGITPFEFSHAEWSMDAAIRASAVNGKWPVFIEQDGMYEIELRRWPRELDRPINDFRGLGGSVPIREFKEDAIQIQPKEARVRIGDVDLSIPVNPAEKKVLFQAQLRKGPAELSTWFIESDGTTRVAYWVYISRI
jgi:arylsulfatase A-like enzyme